MRIIYEPRGAAFEYDPLAVALIRWCAYKCKYCFVPDVTKSPTGEHLEPYIRKDALKLLTKDCMEMQDKGDNREVLMSFTTDPYQPIDDVSQITRKAIEIFLENGINFTILTKGGKRSERDLDIVSICDHPRMGRGRYGTTLTLINPTDINKWEPFASPTEERIHALSEAHRRDIPTWVSLEPIIDPLQSLALIRETLPYVDEYKIGKMNHLVSTFPLEQLWGFVKETKELLDSYEKKYMFKDSMKAYL
jgi:DNA repair photolyase